MKTKAKAIALSALVTLGAMSTIAHAEEEALSVTPPIKSGI